MSDYFTIRCRILAINKGQYTELIVENLNRDLSDWYRYISIVYLPNWQTSLPKLGDIGYLTYQSVTAGSSYWFNTVTNTKELYKESENYFINFIQEQDLCKQDKFDF